MHPGIKSDSPSRTSEYGDRAYLKGAKNSDVKTAYAPAGQVDLNGGLTNFVLSGHW